MRKVIAAINITVDGFCDHTAVNPDAEIHQHYTDLLNSASLALYGRKTFQLMEFWLTVLEHPTGEKDMDDFAIAIDRIPKIVFSNTIKEVEWESAKIATLGLKEQVLALKEDDEDGCILVGSPSLILSLTELDLIDEYQLCIHPVIVGHGLQLFKNLNKGKLLKLTNTKIFSSGPIILYYEPAN